ncbi:MAG TPA: zinc-ribbon domain-containing protein, partial [Polyangiaceae bacterium]|nr:zinc-ribbon domain-containing protein [Polyangiaceae bacterium]
MITCPKCSKDNQDHYKFCLGCGAELPRGAAPKPFAPQTPPHGMKAVPAPAGGGLGGTVAISPPAAPAVQALRPAAPAAPAPMAPPVVAPPAAAV